MPYLFALAIFTGAGLVFWLEPMIGKLLLPLLGGTPAVWATCLAFFQTLLLGGYLVAHGLATRVSVRGQVLAFSGLVALGAIALPVSLAHVAPPQPEAHPVPWLLGALAISVGAPFLALSTTAPLLQRWFAEASRGRDPYWLAVASNAGSLATLLAFPLLLEPWLTLHEQGRAWTIGYVTFLGLVIACGVAAWRSARGPREEVATPEALPWSRRLRWVAWSAVPSVLLTGVTNFVSTDISAVPLLWVVPLALYLVTFILAFAAKADPGVRIWTRLAMVFVPLLLYLSILGTREPGWAVAALHFLTFFVTARALHGALAGDRPAVAQLTEFYAWISLGGALGGIFASLVAPLVFNVVAEYPLALVAALGLLPVEGATWRDRLIALAIGGVLVAGWGFARVTSAPVWVLAILCYLAPLLIAIVQFRRPDRFALGAGPVLLAALIVGFADEPLVVRSFFGVLRVQNAGSYRWLRHGVTLHGLQRVSEVPEERRETFLYYTSPGPIGDVLREVRSRGRPLRVGVVGLGVGSLASYSEPGDRFTFYEIDPAVLHVARDTGLFTYLQDARGAVDHVLGDARQSLERATAQYDLLVLDAFSSDSVPVHLLTREALRDAYLPRLAPGGLLALHLSNRFLDLRSVGRTLAEDAGLRWKERIDGGTDDTYYTASLWMVIAREEADFGGLATNEDWSRRRPRPPIRPWTDDYSNVFAVFDEWEELFGEE